jgi:hypothetical protein
MTTDEAREMVLHVQPRLVRLRQELGRIDAGLI